MKALWNQFFQEFSWSWEIGAAAPSSWSSEQHSSKLMELAAVALLPARGAQSCSAAGLGFRV